MCDHLFKNKHNPLEHTFCGANSALFFTLSLSCNSCLKGMCWVSECVSFFFPYWKVGFRLLWGFFCGILIQLFSGIWTILLSFFFSYLSPLHCLRAVTYWQTCVFPYPLFSRLLVSGEIMSQMWLLSRRPRLIQEKELPLGKYGLMCKDTAIWKRDTRAIFKRQAVDKRGKTWVSHREQVTSRGKGPWECLWPMPCPHVSGHTAGIQQIGAGGYLLNQSCVCTFRVPFSSLPALLSAPAAFTHVATQSTHPSRAGALGLSACICLSAMVISGFP